MKQYSWDEVLSGLCNRQECLSLNNLGTALTIGAFDGPHRGHNMLFNEVLKQERMKKGVITFTRPPKNHTKQSAFSGDVSTLALKSALFEKKGFDFVIVIDFSRNFGRMNGRVFLDFLYSLCAMRFLAVGSDFRCGYKADTGIDEIRSYAHERDISLCVLEPFFLPGEKEKVSSSHIRALISSGDFVYAKRLLGYPVTLVLNALLVYTKTIMQVLPPIGTYNVRVLSSLSYVSVSAEEKKNGILIISEDTVEVKTSVTGIQAVQF